MFSACGDCTVHLSTLREVREKEFHLLIFVAGNGTIIIALSIEQMISEKNSMIILPNFDNLGSK